MALTGEAVQIGTNTGFGQGENRVRGITGYRDENLYVVGATRRRLIRISDLDTLTGEYASAQLPNPVFSLSEFDSNLYVTSHTNLPPYKSILHCYIHTH